MFKNKKRLIYIAITIILIIAISIGVILIIRSVNGSNNTQQTSITTKATADSLKEQALKAELANDTAKAKTLFEQARQQYKELNNTEGVVDTEAQLYLINHPTTTQTK